MYSVLETSLKLRRSRSKVYDLIRQGKLGHYRLDGAIFVSQADIDAYLASCRVEPTQKSTGVMQPPARVQLRHLTLD